MTGVTIGILLLFIIPLVVYYLWIQGNYIAIGYYGSGSFNKREKKYKAEYRLRSRIILIPLITMGMTSKYFYVAITYYIQALASFITIVGYLLNTYSHIAFKWQYGTGVILITIILQTFLLGSQK